MRVGKNLWTGLAAALLLILALVGWGLLDDGPGSQPRPGALSEPAFPTPVLAEGSRPATGDLEGEESDIVPMTPFRVPEITGTVLDPDGLGVGEARVVAEPLRPGTAAGDVETRTDSGGGFAIESNGAWGFALHANGRVSIPAVPVGSYTVRVDVPGRGRIERQLLIPEGTGPFVCAFTVAAPSDLSVRLVPPPPKELTGLSVVAHHPEQQERFATHSAEGFRFEGLPPGPWTLGVRSVPDQPESLLSTQDVTVVLPRPHPATGDIEVPVHALARITFVLPVRRPEDGPIPGHGIGGDRSSIESGDAGQAWWNHFHRYQRRARDFRFSLHDAEGRQIFSTAPTSIQLDEVTQSVRASLIIPAGRFTARLSGPEGLALEAPLRSEEPFLDW